MPLPPAATLLLAVALLLPAPGFTQPAPGPTTPPDQPPAGQPPAGQGGQGNPAQPSGEELNSKERQVLERIRQLKTPRWRVFGACRYDWGTWRLAEGGVRVTASECGDPPVKGSVAVHCETLRINRRVGEGVWEPWRLPLAIGESPTTGGEDLMVASLCANLRPAAPAAPTNPPAGSQPKVPAAAGAPAAPKVQTPR